MNVQVVTLGCKVNQVESRALLQLFLENGFTADEGEKADVILLNSCTVTAEADRKTRQTLRRLRRENPEAVLVLTGCLPQASPEAAAALPQADLVTGTKDRAEILALVKDFCTEHRRTVKISRFSAADGFETALHAEKPEEKFQKAYLKIEDGCDRGCAYCIIPQARGRVRSLGVEEIARRAAQLIANGYREIILTGINLSRCGADFGFRLVDVVETVNRLPGEFRIRLGSLEPDLITETDWQRLAACERLCPQFHLALQSGCDATLSRMRRRYTTAEYRAAAETARRLFPDAGITTDLIAGFPGETEEEFAATCAFVESLSLLRAHVFVYSARPGTPAAALPQVEMPVRRRRAGCLEKITRAGAAAEAKKYLGRTLQVLCEGDSTGFAANGLEVLCPPGAPVGALCNLQIVGVNGTRAVGAFPKEESV